MSSLKSIVFTSNTLPIANENLTISQINSPAGGAASLPIITDFEIPLDQLVTPISSEAIDYIPTFYRLISMKGSEELRNIDIVAYWSDRGGNLYPVNLVPGRSMSVKLVFLKKGLTN